MVDEQQAPVNTREAATAPLSPPGGRGKRRLANLSDVKRALGDTARSLEGGTLDPKRGNAIVYALATLAGVLQGVDVERRVAELESAVEARRRGS
jgi:hypothetical protein